MSDGMGDISPRKDAEEAGAEIGAESLGKVDRRTAGDVGQDAGPVK